MEASLFEIAGALFLAVSAGALLPLFRRWSHRGLHVFVSISAGVFLGTIFLHLLPELALAEVEAPGASGDGHAHGASGLTPWAAALAGVLVLFLVERVVLARSARRGGSDPHTVLWSATYLGLMLHSFSTGLGLVPWLGRSDIFGSLLAPILLHKATEAFSLATVMRLAGLQSGRSVALLLVFALVAPLGLVIGREVTLAGPELNSVLTGFAAGTFLYVALLDLLPEVFHGEERQTPKLLSLLFGIALTAVTLPRLAWLGRFGGEVLEQSLAVFVEMSPFLLLGFLIAGLLSQVIKPAWLSRYLARDDTRSVVAASLVGAPLPLCSCAVLPVAASLRQAGASKGATSAFLIATPETGVDSVTVTYALLGPLMAAVRPLAAVVSAVFTGSIVNAFVRGGLDRPRAAREAAPEDPPAAAGADADGGAACCAHEPAAGARSEPDAAEPGLAWRSGPDARGGFARRALRHAFVDMLDDLTGPMLVGIVLAGAIAALIPPEVFATPLASGFRGMLLMLLIGIPIYTCAAASTPIAAVLILKGLSPGAALVFLLAGPATNLGSLYVTARYLGRRVVVVHVLALAVVTLLCGLATDLVYRGLAVDPVVAARECAHFVPDGLATGCAVVLAILMLVSLARTKLNGRLVERLRGARAGVPGAGEARG